MHTKITAGNYQFNSPLTILEEGFMGDFICINKQKVIFKVEKIAA
ncbi:MAG: hypothetical protein PHE03_08525 [Bacteroidales bacterium]|nr:hypothetical protein [Bacteroidales bacterium]MDD3892332.1 hypothetical protein [Bacteroidales bacterium]